MRLWPGPRPGHHWGAYSAPPDPLAGFQGPLHSREGEGRYMGGWKWREAFPHLFFSNLTTACGRIYAVCAKIAIKHQSTNNKTNCRCMHPKLALRTWTHLRAFVTRRARCKVVPAGLHWADCDVVFTVSAAVTNDAVLPSCDYWLTATNCLLKD